MKKNLIVSFWVFTFRCTKVNVYSYSVHNFYRLVSSYLSNSLTPILFVIVKLCFLLLLLHSNSWKCILLIYYSLSLWIFSFSFSCYTQILEKMYFCSKFILCHCQIMPSPSFLLNSLVTAIPGIIRDCSEGEAVMFHKLYSFDHCRSCMLLLDSSWSIIIGNLGFVKTHSILTALSNLLSKHE